MLWFRRLAEAPNVGYLGNSEIDRTRLPGHDAVPKEAFDSSGNKYDFLNWPRGTASPAERRGATPTAGTESAHKSLRRMYEALELPGTPSDYHFVIQSCCQQLWNFTTRRTEPWVFLEIEKLCWLDIRLLEAFPQMAQVDRSEGPAYFHVVAFDTLIRLYKQEGYLYEALDVAKRAVKFDQQHEALEELQQRVAILEAESVG
jgi:hypothetical protein